MMAQSFSSSLLTELDILLKYLPIALWKPFREYLFRRHSDSTMSIKIREQSFFLF